MRQQRAERIKGRGVIGKTPVVMLVARGGEARSQVMHPVSRSNIKAVLEANIAKDPALMTDSHAVYDEVGSLLVSHETVDHHCGEYVRGTAHTNTAEGLLSQLKRSIDRDTSPRL